MLHALELKNFKAFGKRSRIEFAPITLIFGENSAGKSSILQALNLLKQTRESRETGTLLLPRAENGIVDLGSFQEMLFDHDLERVLSIRVETKLNRELAIEFSFKRASLDPEILLDEIGIYNGKSSKCLARFQPSGTTVEPQDFWMTMGFFHDSRSISPAKLSAVKCIWLTRAKQYWKQDFSWWNKNQKEVLRELDERKTDLERVLKHQMDQVKDNNGQKHSNDELQKTNKRLQRELESLYADIEFFSSNPELKTYIAKRHSEEMKTVLGMQSFLPVGVIRSEEKSSITGAGSLLHHMSDDMIFDVAQIAMAAGYALERTLEALFPIRPFRRPPERWYIFTGTSPQHVGYQGDLLPDLLLRRPELVEETNEWLEKLDIGHKLTVKSMGADSGDLFEVRLIDTRRKGHVDAALPDVGFGVSQLLPFIVQSLVEKGQIISIEQPEVHVHPKLQADLGDLLAAAIKKENPNQFIVETHSEHLILRLQRLVRKQQIKPEDVSVIYISRGPEGAESRRLRLDKGGNFIDNWPKGFFLERLRELG